MLLLLVMNDGRHGGRDAAAGRGRRGRLEALAVHVLRQPGGVGLGHADARKRISVVVLLLVQQITGATAAAATRGHGPLILLRGHDVVGGVYFVVLGFIVLMIAQTLWTALYCYAIEYLTKERGRRDRQMVRMGGRRQGERDE